MNENISDFYYTYLLLIIIFVRLSKNKIIIVTLKRMNKEKEQMTKSFSDAKSVMSYFNQKKK
jgi:hypothetical protein